MNLKVTNRTGFRYGGEHYANGEIILNARDREANLLIAIGKAEKCDAPEPKNAKKGKYKTRDLKPE